jgi:hypothetical protein
MLPGRLRPGGICADRFSLGIFSSGANQVRLTEKHNFQHETLVTSRRACLVSLAQMALLAIDNFALAAKLIKRLMLAIPKTVPIEL